MHKVIHLLVREHSTVYTDINAQSKKLAESIVKSFFKLHVEVSNLMPANTSAIYAQRVLDVSIGMLDTVLVIVHRALKEPFENILINFQQLMTLFALNKQTINSKVKLQGYP